MNVSDGSFHQMKRAIGCAVSERHEQKSEHECNNFSAHNFNLSPKIVLGPNTVQTGFSLNSETEGPSKIAPCGRMISLSPINQHPKRSRNRLRRQSLMR